MKTSPWAAAACSAAVTLAAGPVFSGACSNYHVVYDAGDASGSSSGGEGPESGPDVDAPDSEPCPFALLDAGNPYTVGPDGGENTACDSCLAALCSQSYACCASDPNEYPFDGGLQTGCEEFIACNANLSGNCSAGLTQPSIGAGQALVTCAQTCFSCPY